MPDEEIISLDQIQGRILVLRGYRVLLDSDLARFYGVPTFRFNEAVKRNVERFPEDFRFQITYEELKVNSSQFAMTPRRHRAPAYLPWAFTEHGALMAANVLNSQRAARMSVVIVRAFVALRQMILSQKALAAKLEELDARVGAHDREIAEIVEAIRQLATSGEIENRPKIGFHRGNL